MMSLYMPGLTKYDPQVAQLQWAMKIRDDGRKPKSLTRRCILIGLKSLVKARVNRDEIKYASRFEAEFRVT